jgi:hypothetical protein
MAAGGWIVDDSGRFLELRFDGGRFADHTAPVEILAELPVFQKLIVRVARQLFLKAHSDRTRVPKGFIEAAQLHLTASEANCFTAVLAQPEEASWQWTEEADVTVFRTARDLTVEALKNASAIDGTIPADFPYDAVDLLASIGGRLRGDEALFVRGATGSAAVRVDQTTRARLAQFAKQPLVIEATLDGEVVNFNDVNNTFHLRERAGERTELPFTSDQRDAIVEALSQRPIARVRVQGQLVISNSQRRVNPGYELETFDHERAPEVQRVWSRLESLKKVEDGWIRGEGRAPRPLALARAKEVLARLLVESPMIARPRVFPTAEGGVQAEWVFPEWAVDVCFAEDGNIIAEATNADANDEQSRHFAVHEVTADDASSLAHWLSQLGPAETARV